MGLFRLGRGYVFRIFLLNGKVIAISLMVLEYQHIIMSIAFELARFVRSASYDGMSQEAAKALKMRLLDSLGCAIPAIDAVPVKMIKEQLEEFGGSKLCTLIGGSKTSPDRAAFYNSALIRYLDFNDSFFAPGETCHPSDNIGSVLAAAEYAQITSKEFLTALAVAYQVQCRLSEEAPVRAKGFDHTVQGAYSTAAGISKALGLDVEETTNAIAISGAANNALRVTRTGQISTWKGIAFPMLGFAATMQCFLAKRGLTGPTEIFEGNKGCMDSIAGKFTIDWAKEDLEKVKETIIKKFNAETHAQSVLEGIMELRRENDINADDISGIEVEIFGVAYHIIGGGMEGAKKTIATKEQADHSLPYMLAVALLDGRVMPEQYDEERIKKDDVQQLLQRIDIREKKKYNSKFPEELNADILIKMKDGKKFSRHKKDFEGFKSRPADWDTVEKKFRKLTKNYAEEKTVNDIIEIVEGFEDNTINDLLRQLSLVGAQNHERFFDG
jgi:2-methylcitrate dehydratase